MAHISELTHLPPAESAPPTASAAKRELTESHIALLWERMTMIYGHRWTSSYGEKDDGTWLTGLADVTVEQIKTGLEKCRTRTIQPGREDWPPTLTEFRALCLLTYAAPYHRPFAKALPTPPPNRSIGYAALSAIRRMLGMKPLEESDNG